MVNLKSEEVQALEMRWELLKVELEQMEDFHGRCDNENEINVIHDIQSLINEMETGEYFK